MIDNLSLDQIRTFIAAADAGSFSAAAKELGRSQSVVSQTLANLEGQLGVVLFDRSTRKPKLTLQGNVLLSDARLIAEKIDSLKARARDLSEGLEAELSVVVDVMFPQSLLTDAIACFSREFPSVSLRLGVEALGAVVAPILAGTSAMGIVGTFPALPAGLAAERLLGVPMQIYVAPSHPLASRQSPIPKTLLQTHLQLVLTDRSELSSGREFGVVAAKTWRLADLGAKHAFIREGLGWGSLPRHLAQDDVERGRLVALEIEDYPITPFVMPMFAAYRMSAPPGPAGQWLIRRLKETEAG
ncbi:LysR family transcriptional regulator [Rhizobium sp. M1]|uniref:LysR family transcriptional regulator n=1 Tax=Rhizobium sp. M1 TaxID=2035453 RepID=UPI000BE9CAFE|nr:LysR family transcriptional regulator [Rhizobium sp. M1]PDT10148.1 LysR family transcriptional regulator [Rhizobium sp. M1]